MYKVTLSMPIYNVAPYVERALLSALNQTFDSIEFLIVDDRGTDNSMEIVRKIVAEHPRGKDVRIIEHPHNIGTGATKNTAIDNAQGEYLFFMDSDDEIMTDCIQMLYEKMMEKPVDLVVGSIIEVSVNGEQVLKRLNNITRYGEKCLAKYVYEERLFFPTMTWNKLYDLSFLKRNNIYCYSEHLNEDMVFNLKQVYHANSFSSISYLSILYYRRIDSVTGALSITERKILQYIDILKEYKNIYMLCCDFKLKRLIKYSMLRFLVVYLTALLNSDKIEKNSKINYYNKMIVIMDGLSYSDLLFHLIEYKTFVCYMYYKLPFNVKYLLRKPFDIF